MISPHFPYGPTWESPSVRVKHISYGSIIGSLKRRFKWLSDALHERLPFSTAKTTHSLSTVFEGSRYSLGDQQKVIVESEPNGEKSCTETSDRLKERLYDDVHESVAAYVVVCGVIGENVGLCGSRNTRRARFVSIPDGVEELCEKCFSGCKSLSRVTFGESSSLKLIGKRAFCGRDLLEIHIPDGIERLLMDDWTGLPPQCLVMKLA